jgi:hypothetical protein
MLELGGANIDNPVGGFGVGAGVGVGVGVGAGVGVGVGVDLKVEFEFAGMLEPLPVTPHPAYSRIEAMITMPV